jgi:hypothetical protein
MKRKLEDRLARLAFDDVSASESAELERIAADDAETARTLNEYRSMRAALRDLADVPAHQLSNERLRDAILGQGLKTKPVSTDLSWLWMSGIACASVAILFIAMGRNRSANPQIYIDPNPMDHGAGNLALGSGTENPFGHPFSNLPSVATKVSTAPKLITASTHPILAAHRVRRHHRGDFGESELMADILQSPPDDATFVAPDPAPTPSDTVAETDSEATAKLQPVDAKPQDGVVVIEPDTDQATGAQRATELGTTKNVEVGG